MEAIRSYLETMFLHLPNTPEIQKAKDELWQMMEDKYTELKAEGKSENEAVGTVISEFGNLDELAADLGINRYVDRTDAICDKTLSLEEAKTYLNDYARHAFWTALGVLFCIISVCAPILTEGIADLSASGGFESMLEALGAILMFVFIAIGVGFLVYSGISVGRWKYLKQARYVTDFSTSTYIREEQAQYKHTYALLLTIGIMLCIVSIVPAIAVDAITASSQFWDDFSGMMLFLFVGVGVFFIVMSSMRMGSYKRLLLLTGQGTGSEGAVPVQPGKPRQNRSLPVILTVIVAICLAVVLICGVGSYFGFTNVGTLETSESIPLSAFTAIEADCDVMALTVLPGDSYTIRYSANEKLIPEFQVENGTLILTQNSPHTTVSFGTQKCSVTITVPYSTALDSADISTDVGDITLKELQLASLSLTADVGDIDLAFCQFGDVTLTADVGDIDLDNSTFTSLSATADVGDVSVDLGEVSTDAASNLGNYAMQLSTDIGKVEVNNTDCRRNYVQTGNADYQMTIEVSTGNIKVNY